MLRKIFRPIGNSLHTGNQNKRKDSSSSKRWLARQMRDPFVKEAQIQHYRARSAFKLLEIDSRFHIFKPGDYVIDCGAAPGSWSQVAADKVNALSTEKQNQSQIISCLGDKMADCLISDMAPNATGIKDLDHENIVCLASEVFAFAASILKQDGIMLCKIWDGYLYGNLKTNLEKSFTNCKIVRPDASRKESSELFILAKGYNKS
ncbi:rRNA methyltransferase 2, mitochondrial-like isoform X2 [Antedon mediterranea]|uniref:rRNA methyltransferase 2, mitochondrial-like isoform X2 n=1 Tax=Antedon mediterranea TaxID=105859 RepID=UPI003AF6974A